MSQHHQRHGASPGKGGKDVRQLLARASDLEAKLSNHSGSGGSGNNNASAADDSVAQGYRLKVCEILSDVLLTDPVASLKHDVPGRLWRVCFYQRIGELRGRIQRETTRLHRLKKTSSEKRDGLEAALKTFLGEAIVLYDYLVDRYEGTLKRKRGGAAAAAGGGGRQQGRPPPQSKEPSGGDDNMEQEEEEDPVVIVLYRLLIHRGDLHRYASDYAKSESSYLASSRLRPGMGNPYNQLAVVSQQHREQTVVALYYYARSLCATVEPFEPTSRTNLRRLFQGNRAWYGSNRETYSEVYRHMMEEIGSSGGDGDGWTGGGRLARSGEKTKVMRLALSAFVDLHGSLFLAAAAPSVGAAEDAAALALIGPATDSVISQFRILLSEQCLSDALVTKMVVCNAFAVADCDRDRGERAGVGDPRGRSVVSRAALRLALRFGVLLLERVQRNLERAKRGGAPGRNGGGEDIARSPPGNNTGGGGGKNVRLLGPVVLVADWIRVLPTSIFEATAAGEAGDGGVAVVPPGDASGATPIPELHEAFHSKLCDTWNALAEANPPPPGDDGGAAEYGAAGGGRILKEHVQVRGFWPFADFVDQRRDSTTTASGEEEYAIRMGRMRRCLVEHGRCTFDASAGRFLYGVDADEKMDDVTGGASLTQDEDEEGGDGTGGGPSLAFHAGMDETQSPGLLLPPGRTVAHDGGEADADADDVIVYRAPPAASPPPAPVMVPPVAPMAMTGMTLSNGPVVSDPAGGIPRAGAGAGAVAGAAASSSPRPPPGFFNTPAAVGGGAPLPPPPRPPPGFVPPAGVIGAAAAVGGPAAAPVSPGGFGGGGILRTGTDNPFARAESSWAPSSSSSLFGRAIGGAGAVGFGSSPSHPLGFELGGGVVAGDSSGGVGGPSPSAPAPPANFDLSSLLFDHDAGGSLLRQPQRAAVAAGPGAGAGSTSSGSMVATTPLPDLWGGGPNPSVSSGNPPPMSFGRGLGGGGDAPVEVDGGVDSTSGMGAVGWMFGRPIAAKGPDAHGDGGGIDGTPAGGESGHGGVTTTTTTTNNPFFA